MITPRVIASWKEDYSYFDRLPKRVRQAIANHCDNAPSRLVHSWYMAFGEKEAIKLLKTWRWPKKGV
jgi:hypothetical protein